MLQGGRLSELDVANLLEEIELMCRKDRKAIKSNLAVVLSHLLNISSSPTSDPAAGARSISSIASGCATISKKPEPGWPRRTVLERAYADARARALAETGLPAKQLPRTCPYTLQQSLDIDFLPD